MDVRSYVEGLRRRRESERRAAQERAARAQAVARRCAVHLRGQYGARRVVLFGSLARGDLHAMSDIDLAAEGIDPEELFRAGADLARLAGDIEVDLVPLEIASPGLLARLDEEGVEL